MPSNCSTCQHFTLILFPTRVNLFALPDTVHPLSNWSCTRAISKKQVNNLALHFCYNCCLRRYLDSRIHQSSNQSGRAASSAARPVQEPSITMQRSITLIECRHFSYNYINILYLGVLLWQVPAAVQPLALLQPCFLGQNSGNAWFWRARLGADQHFPLASLHLWQHREKQVHHDGLKGTVWILPAIAFKALMGAQTISCTLPMRSQEQFWTCKDKKERKKVPRGAEF